MGKRETFCAGVAVAAVALAAPAVAQTAAGTDETRLSEIVVTATKRTERLQDVAISAIAMSGDTLRARGITDSADLVTAIPSLNFNATAGWTGKVNFTLRGVGLNNYQEANEAAVAVYQDEAYIASLVGSTISAFDLDRVEVLKGPQGTLFGRSASGGLVHFVSTKPQFDDSGYLNLGFGRFNQASVDGVINAKVSDSVAVRLSGRIFRHGGWLENSLGPNQNADEQYVGRAQITYKPSDTITNTLKVEYGKIGAPDGVGFAHYTLAEQNGVIVRTTGPDAQGYEPTRGFFSVDSELRTKNDIRRWFIQNQLSADLGFATLTSNTAYLDVQKDYLEDNDMGPRPFLIVPVITGTHQWMQEFRLVSPGKERLRWTAGLFYFNWKLFNNIPLIFGDPTSTVFGDFRQDTIVNQKKDSVAVYGQASYDLTEQLTATVGLRAEHEWVNFSLDQGNFVGAYGPSTGVVPVYNSTLNGDALKIDKTYWSGEVGLQYKINPEVMVYLTAKRGIKPGGFNAPFFARPPASAIRFKEEKLDAFELGLKSDFADRRIRLNVAAFYYDYKNYQATQFSVLGTFTGNAKARVYGADVELVGKLSRLAEAGINATFLNATAVVNLGPPRGIVRTDMPQAPSMAFNAYLQAGIPLGTGDLIFRGDLKYQSRTFFDIREQPGLSQGAYAVADIRADWSNDRYSIGAFVRNVTNNKYAAYIGDGAFAGYGNVTPGKPRWWGIQAGYSW